MIKKIDSNEAVIVNDLDSNGVQITYSPDLSETKLGMIKVIKAVLKLPISTTTNQLHSVYNINEQTKQEEIIDTFKNPTKDVFIDITDELQVSLENSINNVKLRISGISVEDINLDKVQGYIDYNYKKQVLQDQATYSIDAGRAGNGNVNLSTGSLCFSHEDVKSNAKVLPISVTHAYNSLNANKEEETVPFLDGCKILPKYNCGKGWKTNFHQYIVKETIKETSFSDKQTSARYTYVDAEGNHIVFLDKYYYKDDSNEKCYITSDLVKVDQDGKLSYLDSLGIVHEVIKETVSETGLYLISKFENMNGVSLLNQDNEEVSTLKNDIKSINKTIKEMSLQIENNNIAKELIETSLEIAELNNKSQTLSLQNERADIDLQKQTMSLNLRYKELYRQYNNLTNNRTYFFAGAATDYDAKAVYPTTTERSVKQEMDSRSNEIDNASQLTLYGADKESGVLGRRFENLKIQEDLLSKNNQYTIDQLNLELKKLEEQNNSLNDSILDYDELLLKKSHQLELLQEQVSEIILTDSNGNVMGFNSTLDPNVYKLFVIMDAYENQVQVVYENNKIEKIIDSDGNVIKFNYENNILVNLEDNRHRITTFNYDGDTNLVEIVYPSAISSQYSYDEKGLLNLIRNSNGTAYHISYLNNKVSIIEFVTYSSKITNSEINPNENFETKDSIKIEYYDYESTQVTNLKTDKTTTYVFDTLGRIINKYKNVFENGAIIGSVDAISYERINDTSSFVIKEQALSENLLSSLTLESSLLPSMSENYFGDGIICGEDVITSSIPDKSAEEGVVICDNTKPLVTKRLTSTLIDKIKQEKITDLVLSGWAKADAAWVNRKNTDYCGKCEDVKLDNELEQLMVENMDEYKANRRFELRAELKYLRNGEEKVIKQYCSFDWMNTRWQYCAFPVTISENPEDELIGISVFFDYTNNTGISKFYGMSLKKGSWEYTEYKNKLKTYFETSSSDLVIHYIYNENKKLTKTIIENKNANEKFETTYIYNSNGSLVRSADYNGIITENVYNDKGSKIKSITYHKDEPANKFCSEVEIDEKGQISTKLNEFGEKLSENTYIENTGIVETSIDDKGNKTCFGYDVNDDTLLQMTKTIDDKINSNIMHYNGDLLTSLVHNNIEVKFEYDGFGEQTRVEVAGIEYCHTEYEDIFEDKAQEDGSLKSVLVGTKTITANANNERFIVYNDIDGNTTKIEFINKDNVKTVILENWYDSYGNLVFINDNAATSEIDLHYDEFGRLTNKNYKQNGIPVSLENKYDRYSNLATTIINIGEINITSSNDYDYSKPEVKLNSITINDITESYAYDKLSRVSETKLGSLYSKQFSYLQKGDHASNLVASEWFGTNGIIKDSLKYNYDSNGNITKIIENGIEIVRLTYDSISRLIREDNKKLNKTITFDYDCGGNIISKTIYDYTTKNSEHLTDGTTIPYSYPTSGWKDQLAYYGEEEIKYDDLGNPTTYRNNKLKWSHGRQLDKFNDIEFEYNASGIRTSKTINNKKTDFFLDGTRILAQNDGNMLVFHYGSEGVIGFTYQGVGEYYYKKNILGDILAIIDKNGREIVKYAYDAWGKHKTYVLNNGDFVDILDPVYYTKDGSNNKEIAQMNPFRYRSYYYDTETNLYYLNSRYYDPEIGRFINSDDLSNIDELTINGINLFAYCGNNPISFTDPFGTTKWWEWLVASLVVAGLVVGSLFTGGLVGAAFAGAAIGAGFSLGTQAISGQLNWGQFALDIGVGAISGAIGASGISRFGSIVVGTLIGGTSNFLSQLINGRSINEINWWSVGISATIGGISGAFSGAGAKNKKGIDKAISDSNLVKNAQNSVAKVGSKMANGLYATAQGAKSAYTQTMNRLSNAIFSAATTYAKTAIFNALKWYGISTFLTSLSSFIPGW